MHLKSPLALTRSSYTTLPFFWLQKLIFLTQSPAMQNNKGVHNYREPMAATSICRSSVTIWTALNFFFGMTKLPSKLIF
jgi:hypothetical protein